MKKNIIIISTVFMTLVSSLTTFASVKSSFEESTNHEGIYFEIPSQGKGACRHASCKCTWYNRAQGGAGKCVCGHWDYVHN